MIIKSLHHPNQKKKKIKENLNCFSEIKIDYIHRLPQPINLETLSVRLLARPVLEEAMLGCGDDSVSKCSQTTFSYSWIWPQINEKLESGVLCPHFYWPIALCYLLSFITHLLNTHLTCTAAPWSHLPCSHHLVPICSLPFCENRRGSN